MTTESRGAHEPARSKFSQQQLPATRPVLSPAFTGRVAIALAVALAAWRQSQRVVFSRRLDGVANEMFSVF